MSQQINLYNPVFLKREKHFSLLTMLQAMGLILLGSLLFFAYAKYQVAHLEKQSLESTQRFNAEQARLMALSSKFSPEQSNKRLQDEVQQLEKQLSEAQQLVDTLRSGAVGNTSGYSEYMRAFARQVPANLWLTGFNVVGDGAQMSLRGGVTDPALLPVYIQQLGRERVMQGKSFSTLQMRQPNVAAPATEPLRAAPYLEFVLHSSVVSEAQP